MAACRSILSADSLGPHSGSRETAGVRKNSACRAGESRVQASTRRNPFALRQGAVIGCLLAARIRKREATALAVLPQSPTHRRPRVATENTAATQAAYRLWQRLATERGFPINNLDASFALRPEARVPREVPHLARRLFNQAPESPAQRSTIDLAKQHSIEQAIAHYLAQRREVGIANACALLVHAPTRQVLGYVGSAGFLNSSILGQVDAVSLKPI